MNSESLRELLDDIEDARKELQHISARMDTYHAGCKRCETFYAEPGSTLCRPCIDTCNEIQVRA